MSGTLGPAKSWRVVYDDNLYVTFFKETDGMLYTGQNCFEHQTKNECLAEMRALNLKFECWKFWIYPENTCTAPVLFGYYEEDKIVEIGDEKPDYGYAVRQTYEDCIEIITDRSYRIK